MSAPISGLLSTRWSANGFASCSFLREKMPALGEPGAAVLKNNQLVSDLWEAFNIFSNTGIRLEFIRVLRKARLQSGGCWCHQPQTAKLLCDGFYVLNHKHDPCTLCRQALSLSYINFIKYRLWQAAMMKPIPKESKES